MKSPHTKNTLLKKRTSQRCKQFFLREYFFSHPNRIIKFFSPTLQKKIKSRQRTVLTWTDTALNVNRFAQSVCGLQTTHLRTDSRAADNIRLKEIKKRRALRGKQRVELLINSVALTNSGASKPFFFLLL